jgi:hypothetical protein
MKSLSALQKKFIKHILDLDTSKAPIQLDRVIENGRLIPEGMHIGKPWPERETIQIYYDGFKLDDVNNKHLSELLEIIEITFWLDKSSYIIIEKPLHNNISIGEKIVNPNKGWMSIGSELIVKGLRDYFSGQRVFVTEDLRQLRKDNFMVKEEKYLSSNKKISVWALGISILAFILTVINYFLTL